MIEKKEEEDNKIEFVEEVIPIWEYRPQIFTYNPYWHRQRNTIAQYNNIGGY